jgi:hypothetical protein
VLEHRSRTARRFPPKGVVWLRATRPQAGIAQTTGKCKTYGRKKTAGLTGAVVRLEKKVCSAPAGECSDDQGARSIAMPNKRIEFAPFGRPTRKQLCCLLAAHSRR